MCGWIFLRIVDTRLGKIKQFAIIEELNDKDIQNGY